MTWRHKAASEIWHNGASNPRAVARALVTAIDEACEEGRGSAGSKDPAVQMILDHLCFLCGLPQPSLSMELFAWDEIVRTVEELK